MHTLDETARIDRAKESRRRLAAMDHLAATKVNHILELHLRADPIDWTTATVDVRAALVEEGAEGALADALIPFYTAANGAFGGGGRR